MDYNERINTVLKNLHAGGDDLMKSERKSNPKSPQTAFFDPFGVYSHGITGAQEKVSPLTFNRLRAMADTEVAWAIIKWFQDNVARFATPNSPKGDPGFKIATVDEEYRPDKRDKKEMKEIENFLLMTGTLRSDDRPDNLDTFLRKIVKDSMTLDAMAIELVPNSRGEIAEMYAVDAATIKVCRPEEGFDGDAKIRYIQDVEGTVYAKYAYDELIYGIRNVRTDIRYAGYGESELEVAIRLITGLINGLSYNISYFTKSSVPLGLLSIVGNMGTDALQDFKREWYTQLRGPASRWKIPMIQLEEGQGVNWTDIKGTSKDMEYHLWMQFQINLLCALYGVNPSAIGFEGYNPGSKPLFGESGSKTQTEQDENTNTGLRPVLNFVGSAINQRIMPMLFDGRYKMVWTGIDEEDEARKLEMQSKRLQDGLATVNEIRAENDQEPIKAKWADAPAN
nr:phage portal protein [Candidatus Omnitrophota bacterium]